MESESTEDVELKGTFEVYKAEADILKRQGEYKKAIDSYKSALELKEGERSCLVNRSKCYLQIGDTKQALKDAEDSLAEDKTFHKGIYQKAEALYYMGNFEHALVFYHRGNKLRPELRIFRLGIQKAQEAIDNSVGSAKKVQLTTKGDLSFFTEQEEKQKKRKLILFRPISKPKVSKEKEKRDVNKAATSEKTIKQLLGELYGDRKYLEKLLKETDSSTHAGRTIAEIAEGGLWYLDTRTDFWRQQKPIYVRKYEQQQQRRQRSVGRLSTVCSSDFIIKELEKIDAALNKGEYTETLKLAQKCLNNIDNLSRDDLSNRLEIIANLHSYLGNAYLELDQYKKALHHHGTDLELGRSIPIDDVKARGLDNMGRVYARMGNFEKAIEVWEEKIPLCKTPLEQMWLYHEIGRCYLELNKFEKANSFGERSLAIADSENNKVWQLQASVLIAQSQVKLGNYYAALNYFEKSLEYARELDDPRAQNAISKAFDEVSRKILEAGTKKVDSKAEIKNVEEEEDAGEGEEQTAEQPASEQTEDVEPEVPKEEVKTEEDETESVDLKDEKTASCCGLST